MDSERRQEGMREEALFNFKWEQRGLHKKDKGPDMLAQHAHMLATPTGNISPFSVWLKPFTQATHIHKKHIHTLYKYKVTEAFSL